MQIWDLKKACEAGESDDRIDLDRFDVADVPAVIVGLPAYTAMVLIAEDGSLDLIDNGRMTSEMLGRLLPRRNALRDAAAQEIAADFHTTQERNGVRIPYIGSFAGTHVLLAANRACRRLFKLDPRASIKEVSQAAIAAGGDPAKINEYIEAFGAKLRDPIFHPRRETSWDAVDQQLIEEVLVDALCTDSRYGGEPVSLKAAFEDKGAELEIDIKDWHQIEARAMAILKFLVDVDQRFRGTSWEYNDGAASRKSGYYSYGATIFDSEGIEPMSKHEQLQAYERLKVRLEEKGMDAASISNLLAS